MQMFKGQYLRLIAAIVAGILVGTIFNGTVSALALKLYPLPDGINWADVEAVEHYLANLPVMAYVIILVAHVGQSFAGSLVAAIIGKSFEMYVALVIGMFSLIGGITNMMSLPLPTWMWIEAPLYIIAACVAAKLVMSRRAART